MPNNLRFFAEKYDKAAWHTVRTLLVVIILSIISTIGLWNLSLGELREQIELAKQLQERWKNQGSINLGALSTGAQEDQALAERYRLLLKDNQVTTPKDLERLIATLEDKYNGEYQRIGLNVFGVQFVWRDLIITRWLALAISALFLCLFLEREKELLKKGKAIGESNHSTASLYTRCTLCPLLISPFGLETTTSLRWRHGVVRVLLAMPGIVFATSMAFFFFKAKSSDVPIHLFFINIIFAMLFTGLLIWSLKVYRDNISEWDGWWELGRNEQEAMNCEGNWNFKVDVDDPETQQFSHRGVAEIHKTSLGFEVAGSSFLRNGHAEPVECAWDSAHAVFVDGKKLLLRYQFHYLEQQFRAQAEIDVNPRSSESMAGHYFQLMPILYNTYGRMSFSK